MDDLNNIYDTIYEGGRTKTPEWSHGWIDSSGVYNPNSNRFLSNTADTSNVNTVTNDSSSTIYIVYFSSYTDLSNFTYDSFEWVSPGASRNINKNKSFFLIESTAITNDGLSGVSLYETTPLDYLSYNNMTNDKAHKQNIFFAYCSDLSWTIDGNNCSLTVNGTIRVRFDTGNASVDTTKDAFLAIASEFSLVTVSNGVVIGTHFAVIFDFTDNSIKIVDTSLRTTYVNTGILFYWHYGILGGALVNNKVAVDVTNGISGANNLPDYLEIEAVSCRNKLISACNEKSFVIAFTTDNHYGATNATNFPTTVKTINRVNELYKFDVVIDGGDLINGDKPKTEAVNLLTNAVGMVSDICDISYTLIGNHDDDSFTSSETPLFTKQELYAMMHRHNGINLDDSARTEHYGYKDFNSYGIRLIILDSVYGENGHDSTDWGYSDDQLTWFTTKALNTQNQVIIFSHMAFTPDYIAYGSTIKNGAAMRTVVESFISNGGVVIGLFHGHNHWDYIGQYSQTNGFKEVSTGCGRMISGPDISYAHPEGATMETRTEGTATQELWDAIVVKPLARQVTIVRYGAGSNKANRGYSY